MRASLVLVTCLVGTLLTATQAAAVDEFPLPSGTKPGGITLGPDGALWFTAEGTNKIHRMTAVGALDPPEGFAVPINGTNTAVTTVDKIVAGPDGALWFTQPRDNEIGRITTSGVLTDEFSLPVPGGQPEGIAVGADGALWFTAGGIGKIGRSTTAGAITLHPAGSELAGIGISDITAASDGALWYTESAASPNAIGRITTAGAVTNHFSVPTPDSEPSSIAEVPGAGLWFTEFAADAIGRITLGGTITEYPNAGAGPSAIASGGDGALWYTESTANAIGRITTGGVITNHVPVPTAAAEPSDVTTGPDGALWFTEFAADKIGRIETAPPPPPVAPAPFVPPPLTLPPIQTPTVRACIVPRVRGMTVRKAKRRLRRAHCRYRIRGRGRVVATRPRAGKRTRRVVLVTARPVVRR
jgi:virginiamycin B lyase